MWNRSHAQGPFIRIIVIAKRLLAFGSTAGKLGKYITAQVLVLRRIAQDIRPRHGGDRTAASQGLTDASHLWDQGGIPQPSEESQVPLHGTCH
jgi:hypothetical protein